MEPRHEAMQWSYAAGRPTVKSGLSVSTCAHRSSRRTRKAAGRAGRESTGGCTGRIFQLAAQLAAQLAVRRRSARPLIYSSFPGLSFCTSQPLLLAAFLLSGAMVASQFSALLNSIRLSVSFSFKTWRRVVVVELSKKILATGRPMMDPKSTTIE